MVKFEIIHDTENFGVMFNMVLRRYIDTQREDLLDLTLDFASEYLKKFSIRTAHCAIRDICTCNAFPYFYATPEEQKDRYNHLFDMIFRHYITLEKIDLANDKSVHSNYVSYTNAFTNLYLIVNDYTDEVDQGRYSDHCFKDVWDLAYWARETGNDRWIEGLKSVDEGTVIVIKEDAAEMFGRSCLAFVEYSIGRLSYMPSLCMDFVLKNTHAIQTDQLEEIRDFVRNGKNNECCDWRDWDRFAGKLDEIAKERKNRAE